MFNKHPNLSGCSKQDETAFKKRVMKTRERLKRTQHGNWIEL